MQTIWLSPAEYVTGDPSMDIRYPSVNNPSTVVTSKTTGDYKWVYIGLNLPERVTIEELSICYQVSNPRSFISQVRLAEMATPNQAMVRHDDPTDLRSKTPACYKSTVGKMVPTPGHAVILELRLYYRNTADKIYLGAVGIGVSEQTVGSSGFLTLVSAAAPVSNSGEANIRFNNGALEASINGRNYKAFSEQEGVFKVRDFGAAGDGVTDDSGAIQACIDAAIALDPTYGGKVLLEPHKTYLVKSELIFKGGGILDGQGAAIKAGAAVRSIITMAGTITLRNVRLMGNRLATHCLRLAGCSLSIFDLVSVSGSLSDGVLLKVNLDNGGHTGNDNNTFSEFISEGCGTLYITSALNKAETGFYGFFTSTNVTQITPGTCDFTTGDNIVVFSGLDVTTLGLRPGDPIRVGTGGNKRFGMITAVTDATHLEVAFDTGNSYCDITAMGQDFAIGRGDAFHEERGGNGINTFEGRQLHRGNAGYAFAFDGLYGPRMYGSVQCGNHPAWFIRVGTYGHSPVITSCFHGLYFINTGSGKYWLLRAAQNILVSFPLDQGLTADENISYCGNKLHCGGIYLNSGGLQAIGAGVVNKLATTKIGQEWGGSTLYGSFKIADGFSSVTEGTVTRADSSASMSMFCRAEVNGDTTINNIATTDNSAELLILGAYGNGKAILTNSGNISLKSDTVKLIPGEYIFLLGIGIGWLEIGRSGLHANDTGNPGNTTQNAINGRVAIAQGQASVTVTNNKVTPSSIIHATLQSSDPTLTQILTVVPAAGSFVITGNAIATSACNVCWTLAG